MKIKSILERATFSTPGFQTEIGIGDAKKKKKKKRLKFGRGRLYFTLSAGGIRIPRGSAGDD